MQNRLLPSYQRNRASKETPDESIDWNRRLTAIFVLFAVCFLIIGARLAWIQTNLRDEYLSAFNQTRVEFEVIPGQDGRILTDETVLAADVARYNVEVHYRWLQTTPSENWLTQKARAEIPRGQRRTKERVEAAKNTVLQRRDEMWQRLSVVSRVSQPQLLQRRMDIQKRVQKIAASVNRRRDERELRAVPPSAEPGLSGLLKRAKQEITSPPRRRSLAPIIVQEELDYHPIVTNVSLEVAADIRAHPELYPGLQVHEVTARVYPQKTLAAHLVGSRSRDMDSETPHRVGRSGIERSYDGRLRGIDGRRKLTFNRRGEVIRTEIVRQPVRGQDVTLTIDSALQRSAESLLDQALRTQPAAAGETAASPTPPGGCILVLDTHSGDVLTVANAPRFDVNQMIRPSGDTWNATITDPRHPLFPRATQMTVPPGSVFKVLSAAAMLESSDINPAEHRFCQGYLDRPDRHRCYIFRHFGTGHNQVTLRSALAQSCNVYFFQAARSMGPEPFVQWADRFGFGQPTGIDLPFERSGQVPSPAKTSNGKPRTNTRWYPGDTLGLAIGQSRLTVTPFQVVRMMAAIANGGYLLTPRVADDAKIASNSATHLRTTEYSWTRKPRRRIPGLTDASIAEIRHGLFSAVNDMGGTGYKSVRLDAVAIAGKTGTAEVGGGKPDHAWFAGYVPADRPRFAFVVMLEHGGSGGSAAGPVARKLVEAMLNHGLLQAQQLDQQQLSQARR